MPVRGYPSGCFIALFCPAPLSLQDTPSSSVSLPHTHTPHPLSLSLSFFRTFVLLYSLSHSYARSSFSLSLSLSLTIASTYVATETPHTTFPVGSKVPRYYTDLIEDVDRSVFLVPAWRCLVSRVGMCNDYRRMLQVARGTNPSPAVVSCVAADKHTKHTRVHMGTRTA